MACVLRLMYGVCVDSRYFTSARRKHFVFVYSRTGRSRKYKILTRLPPHFGSSSVFRFSSHRTGKSCKDRSVSG
jgi:hypothetical protein